MNFKQQYKKILSEAIEKRQRASEPHVNDAFGAVVDHNASAGIDPNTNPQTTIDRAWGIVQNARSQGHQGMSVNEKGQIVSVKTETDWLGRGSLVYHDVIRATSRPFYSRKGEHIWNAAGHNRPDVYGAHDVDISRLPSEEPITSPVTDATPKTPQPTPMYIPRARKSEGNNFPLRATGMS